MNKGGLINLTSAQRAGFDWLSSPQLKKVVVALEAVHPESARFVGGCVRDSLLGFAPKDYDIATCLEPQAVVAALKTAGLRSAPTGLDHGTITAIVDHQGIEVTTLRTDVSTDGRRASIAFTKDWTVDAHRRDFTVNAIYLTPSGKLYDPVGGLADIQARKIRFIGEAQDRLCEDYLRILRFFRFTARFSDEVDEAGLAACIACKDGLKKLSAERIGAELMAIVTLPRAKWVIGMMHEAGILQEIWKEPPDLNALGRLREIAPDSSAPLALAVLFGAGGEGIGAWLRLSNAEKSVRANALRAAAQFTSGLDQQAAQAMLYRFGRDVFCDGAAAAYAFGNLEDAEYSDLSRLASTWSIPVFPITGRHILDKGVPAGPAIATILQEVERQWIDEGFPDEARTQALLEKAMAQPGV